jgi:hypothetical protein
MAWPTDPLTLPPDAATDTSETLATMFEGLGQGAGINQIKDAVQEVADALNTPGGTGKVWRATGASSAAFGAVQTADIATGGVIGKRQLNYVASTDLANATAVSATTWTTLLSAQNFSVDDANSIICIFVRGVIRFSAPASTAGCSSRLNIDAGAATYHLGGETIGTAEFGNVLSGAGATLITGLSAATHTVALQVWSSQSATVNCRASTQPDAESLAVTVLEIKR